MKLEHAISLLLRWGVILSALLIIIGFALTASDLSDDLIQQLRLGPGGGRFALTWDSLTVGIVLLVLLPIIRVVMVAFAFILKRDWLYAGFSSLVLIVLIISWSLGAAH